MLLPLDDIEYLVARVAADPAEEAAREAARLNKDVAGL
jgi:hypothetical protein